MVIDWWDTDCEGLGVAVTRDDLETLAARIDAALREARAEALEEAAAALYADGERAALLSSRHGDAGNTYSADIAAETADTHRLCSEKLRARAEEARRE
jgi:Tfp pilus assembly protein FimT